MSLLEILTHPHDTLAAKATDLTSADILSHEIQTLIEDMKDTCHDAGGLGLAANQVGSDANLFVYRVLGGLDVLINPEVVFMKEKMHSKGEACLSVPGQYYNVKRFKKIYVKGLDEHAEPVEITTKSKIFAKILQHEIDHLNGVTIADKGKRVQ
jgi:peptide deformylase